MVRFLGNRSDVRICTSYKPQKVLRGPQLDKIVYICDDPVRGVSVGLHKVRGLSHPAVAHPEASFNAVPEGVAVRKVAENRRNAAGPVCRARRGVVPKGREKTGAMKDVHN